MLSNSIYHKRSQYSITIIAIAKKISTIIEWLHLMLIFGFIMHGHMIVAYWHADHMHGFSKTINFPTKS